MSSDSRENAQELAVILNTALPDAKRRIRRTKIISVMIILVMVAVAYAMKDAAPMLAAALGLTAIAFLAILAVVVRRLPPEDDAQEFDEVHPDHFSILLLILAGLCLAYVPGDDKYLKALHHVGIGLIVAGTVTWIWQLDEMKTFFLRFATGVILDLKYLVTLNQGTLHILRQRAIEALFQKTVDNRDHYELEKFTGWLDDILESQVLPVADGQRYYRKDVVEHITIKYMTLDDVFRDLSAPPPGGESYQPGLRMFKETKITTFRVISPTRSCPDYDLQLSGLSSDTPILPNELAFRVRVGSDKAHLKPLKIDFTDIEPGGTAFVGTEALPFKDGVCEVYIEEIEYRSAESDNWIMQRMNTLTHGFKVEVNIINAEKPLAFEGSIMGVLKREAYRDQPRRPNGCTLEYPGWLLPDHSYFLWWWASTK